MQKSQNSALREKIMFLQTFGRNMLEQLVREEESEGNGNSLLQTGSFLALHSFVTEELQVKPNWRTKQEPVGRHYLLVSSDFYALRIMVFADCLF